MSTTDLKTYNGQLARLDRERILRAGRAVGERVYSEMAYKWPERVRPVAINYEPGNGTRYALLFVPVLTVEQLHDEIVPCGIRDIGGEIDPGWCVVSKLEGKSWSYPFRLAPGWPHYAGYIASHTNDCFPDGCALAALFRVICDVPLEDPEP